MKQLLKYLSIITLFITTTSHAIVDLQLTQGVQGAIPITIAPFAGQPNNNAPDNIATVIAADLQNSGRFQVKPAPDNNHPSNAQQLDFAYWQQQKVNNLVIGSVTPEGSGQYRVTFQLVNPYANQSATGNSSEPAWQKSIVLTQNFASNPTQLRALAHHISDLIYENLTGERGVFSTRIAYVVAQQSGNSPSNYVLEISDMDGYAPKPLLKSNEPVMSPKWSPDGKKLAYVSFEKNRPIIYVQDVATGSRQIVSDSPGLNSAPAWSPDGSRLALVQTRTGSPKIFVMDVNARRFTQVTNGESIDTEPVWSADGRSILFTSNRGGSPQIYRADVNGGAVQRVTFQGNYNASPSLSPDGQTLAMLNGAGNGFNIAIQNLSSGRQNVLTRSGNNQSPSIAPNGKMVLYSTQSGGRGVLGMVSSDGRVMLVLPSRDGDVREPAWGPFLNKS